MKVLPSLCKPLDFHVARMTTQNGSPVSSRRRKIVPPISTLYNGTKIKCIFLKKKNIVWHFQQCRHAITLTGVHPLISHALTYSIPANLFTFIGVTFFILRVPRFFVGSDNIWRCPKTFRRLPKMLRRVPSNTNTGTQRNIDFPTKKREFGESRSST